jgi:ribosomal protein S18 acetylase RimI-like enzyme
MNIAIADLGSCALLLAEFFARNLTPDYISHSELQGYRAIRPQIWAANITSVLQSEISERLGQSRIDFPVATSWRGVVTAAENNSLVGIALVTSSFDAAVPFGIIEDIVVSNDAREEGRGEIMMRWIIDQFQRSQVRRVLLESGVGNDRAHHFFERLGFEQVSIVMMRDL